ncbi:mitochondrial outer membrane translocase complex, subunit Tom5 [Trichoderma pleuroticola]
MFGGFAPPQQSPEEIRAMEAEATFTVQQVAATAFMLYLCMSCAMERGRRDDPFSPSTDASSTPSAPLLTSEIAPFAVDMISRIF